MENCQRNKKLCNTLQLYNTKKINGIKVLIPLYFIIKIFTKLHKNDKISMLIF